MKTSKGKDRDLMRASKRSDRGVAGVECSTQVLSRTRPALPSLSFPMRLLVGRVVRGTERSLERQPFTLPRPQASEPLCSPLSALLVATHALVAQAAN